VPAELAGDLVRGSLVRVPLGAREVTGVVDGLAEAPEHPGEELKPLIGAGPHRGAHTGAA
jgi:primosomal protein N'